MNTKEAEAAKDRMVAPQGAHILIVDDDAEMRTLLSTYLTVFGFRITEAADGSGMRASLAHADIDLVLLDIGLSRQDGLSLLREVSCAHSVRVIIVSGRRELIDRVVGLEVGADDYVTKPFHLQEVLARVRSVLRGRQNASSSRKQAQLIIRIPRFLSLYVTIESISNDRLHLWFCCIGIVGLDPNWRGGPLRTGA